MLRLSGFRQLFGSDGAAGACTGVAKANGGRVGITSGAAAGVKVGKDVGLGTGVGGKGVFVGIAALVAATIVHAAATAVP